MKLLIALAAIGAASGQTIVDVAQGSSDFSTLTAALTAADLVETLSGDGPFTVQARVLHRSPLISQRRCARVQ